jgi:hypothetical protein
MAASPDQQILAPEQSVRQFATQAENLTKFNLQTPDDGKSSFGLEVSELDNLAATVSTSAIEPTHLLKLANTKTFFEAPYSPIFSNNNTFSSQDYDMSNMRTRR